jgi:hypothetical protein
MVQRLNAEQTRQIIRDLGPDILRFQSPEEPLSLDTVEQFSGTVVEVGTGRAYGLFDGFLRPQGVLIGLIVSDHHTGLLVGYEHHWWVKPGQNGLPLLRAFEKECKAEGCSRVFCGISAFSGPQRMERIYRKLGYKAHSTTVVKEL